MNVESFDKKKAVDEKTEQRQRTADKEEGEDEAAWNPPGPSTEAAGTSKPSVGDPRAASVGNPSAASAGNPSAASATLDDWVGMETDWSVGGRPPLTREQMLQQIADLADDSMYYHLEAYKSLVAIRTIVKQL